MTQLSITRLLRRETAARFRGKNLVIELDRFGLAIRPKGARWKYRIDYESIFSLGAKQEAERKRMMRKKRR